MGYLPIFLYLFSFVFLFVLVINNSIKSKKTRYEQSLDKLVKHLKALDKDASGRSAALEKGNLGEIEKYYWSLKANSDIAIQGPLNESVHPLLAQAKLHLYWYNNLVREKPYSFVARIMGHSPI